MKYIRIIDLRDNNLGKVKEFKTLKELYKEISIIYSYQPQTIRYEYKGYNEQLGWDSYYIYVNDSILGLSDSMLT